MKSYKLVVLATTIGVLSSGSSHSQGLTLNFANTSGGSIQFGGSDHEFSFATGAGGYDWTISSESGGSSAVGLSGSFLSGPFTYGSIANLFSGALQEATVTGPSSTIEISDGTGFLTGTVDFEDISTLYSSVGVFNADLNINVTGITYGGSNPDLLALLNNQPGTLDLSFQFSPGMSLSQLSTGSGPYATSYSGSISVPTSASAPEPATIALYGSGALCLLWLRRRG